MKVMDQPGTYNFLLVIHSNYGPISSFHDKWRFWSHVLDEC